MGGVELAPDLTALPGQLNQTLEWQSPAFAEYGYGTGDGFRDEPAVESMHGPVALFVDSAVHRTTLDDDVLAGLMDRLRHFGTPDGPADLVIAFNAPDLSSTGGLWRSTIREMRPHEKVITAGSRVGVRARRPSARRAAASCGAPRC